MFRIGRCTGEPGDAILETLAVQLGRLAELEHCRVHAVAFLTCGIGISSRLLQLDAESTDLALVFCFDLSHA